MRKTFYLLIGALAGAAMGATIATLLAPYSGREMQERIRVRFREVTEEGKRAATARRVELQTQLEAFKRGAPVPSAEASSEQV